MRTAPSSHSTAKSTAVASTYKPAVRLTAHRGWYRVQSGSNPDVWYETSANSCTCPARKPCKHMKYARRLNIAFYVEKEAAPATCPTVEEEHAAGASIVPSTELDAQADEAEARLAQARRALTDTDRRDDSYAVLWRQVDTLERAVAALHYQAMRAA